jgi:hypothetical protein
LTLTHWLDTMLDMLQRHSSHNTIILARVEQLWTELQRTRRDAQRYDELVGQIRHEAEAFMEPRRARKSQRSVRIAS